jgi:hypothetical protein
MMALGRIGPDAKDALSDLLVFLRTSDAKIRFALTEPADFENAANYLYRSREAASFALGRIGPEGIKALREELGEQDFSRQMWALRGLAEAGPGSEAAGSALRAALADGNPSIRILAAKALWRIEKKPDDALPVLVAVLRAHRPSRDSAHAQSAQDAEAALEVLGEMGPAAAKAIPEVEALLRDGFWGTAEALCRIQPGSATGLAYLKRDLARTHTNALVPLRKLGPLARPLVPALVQYLREEDYRPDAVEALRLVDPDAAAEIGLYR